MKAVRALALSAVAVSAMAQHTPLKLMGREVTVTGPVTDRGGDDAGASPPEPAKVCIQGPPQEQCYTSPKNFGWDPTVEVVQLRKGLPALLFSAASGGVSGWGIHFALVHPGATGGDLDSLLLAEFSNQNRHAFWDEPGISDSAIFVVADFVWGPDEGHYDAHRFVISAYVRGPNNDSYYLEDQFMTVRKYDLEANEDVLASERAEILARLKRVVESGRKPVR